MHPFLTLSIIFISFLIMLSLIGMSLEAKYYNKGICPHCNSKLYNFDMDSQGGRGYTCNECNYTTWVSYSFIDKHKKGKVSI